MKILELLTHSSNTAQRCQRNWDLTKSIPVDTLNMLKQIVINAPTKQNEDYYSVIFITDRNKIEEIYNHTTFSTAAGISSELSKNPQVLANLLVAFCSKSPTTFRNPIEEYSDAHLIETNQNQSIGIASGQLVMAAAMLGLKTGFCGCFNSIEVSNILLSEPVKLLVGIGYPDETKDRRRHQNIDTMLGTFNKPIDLTFISNEGCVVESIYEQSNDTHSIFISYKPPAPILGLTDLSWMADYGLTSNDIEIITLEIHKICNELRINPTSSIHVDNNVLYSTWRGSVIDDLIEAKERILKINALSKLINNLRSAGWTVE
jgi:nitroreductase